MSASLVGSEMCIRDRHWSTTQKTIALSSGEAELAGIAKGAAEGLGLLSLIHISEPTRLALI
eukprot:6971910-Alexandrium_andersonii.AAC.1